MRYPLILILALFHLSFSDEVLLSGRGYAHYHLYPDVGQAYCGIELDFLAYEKLIAAVSPSIHKHFDYDLCQKLGLQLHVTSELTEESIIVTMIDMGGVNTTDFNEPNQHIMDLSQEAFDLIDIDKRGWEAGRLYIRWEIIQKTTSVNKQQQIPFSASAKGADRISVFSPNGKLVYRGKEAGFKSPALRSAPGNGVFIIRSEREGITSVKRVLHSVK